MTVAPQINKSSAFRSTSHYVSYLTVGYCYFRDQGEGGWAEVDGGGVTAEEQVNIAIRIEQLFYTL